jgi:hypothetical protein
MKRLASAILIQTVKDWDDEAKRPEIREFLSSPWFDDLAELAGFEAKQTAAIRAKLIAGDFGKGALRAAYR